MTTPPLVTRDAFAKALAEHVNSGEVMTALGGAWVTCSCGDRIEVPVVDLMVRPRDVRDAFHTHQADALLASGVVRDPATLVRVFRTAAELVVQDVRAQRGDHIASLVEDSFAAHFDRAAALAKDPS